MGSCQAPLALIWLLSALVPRAEAAAPQVASAASEDSTWVPSLELGFQFAQESNLFWQLPRRFGPDPQYQVDRHWWEGYAKGGLRFNRKLGNDAAVYGGLMGVASGTQRKDPYEAGDTGRITLEEGMLGVRYQASNQLGLDASFGTQEFRVGSGMLIANGGSNGFERGALKLGPRKAWKMAGLLRIQAGSLRVDSFYLAPNEIPSKDSSTRLAGLVLEKRGNAEGFMGLSVGKVLTSTSPYPQAAPGGVGAPVILEGAREGLTFVYAYGRWTPFQKTLPGAWVSADVAIQRHARMDLQAHGERLEVGHVFAQSRWRPTLAYSYQRFSGDDPNTTRIERFDPLHYEGNPDAWATGSKSSMVFINTNVASHQLKLSLNLSPSDFLTLYFAHVRAHRLRSPLQFGQGTRPNEGVASSELVSGVTKSHLSDDLFIKYTRALGKQTYLTAGLSFSVPGAGIQALSATRMPTWSGLILNLIKQY